jgi:hypothetical protein
MKHKWTPNELEILWREYPANGRKKTAAILGLPLTVVVNRVKRAKLSREHRKPFTEKEMEIIRLRYPEEGAAAVARLLKRHTTTVMKKAHYMGIHWNGSIPAFSAQEIEIMKTDYLDKGSQALSHQLGRSPQSIYAKGAKMGLFRTWEDKLNFHPVSMSETELAYLAGFIDGDGMITLKTAWKKKNRRPYVALCNSSTAIMDWAKQKIPTPGTFLDSRPTVDMPQRNGAMIPGIARKMNQFRITGLTYYPLFKALLPYLVIKKPQMEILLEWIALRLSKRLKETTTDRQQLLERMLAFMNLPPSKISEADRLKIYRSSTWEPLPILTRRMAL